MNRDEHVKEAEALLVGAREDIRRVYGTVAEAVDKGDTTALNAAQKITLDRADFALRAAEIHAQLALVTPPKPAAPLGGYA